MPPNKRGAPPKVQKLKPPPGRYNFFGGKVVERGARRKEPVPEEDQPQQGKPVEGI